MAKRGGAVHVTTHRRHYVGKDGVARDYETHLLRRSWREDGKVRNETVANLSHLPGALIEVIRRSLTGEAFVPASAAATVTRSVPHGHVAALWAQATALGMPALLGPAGRHRDLAMALIISRVDHPGDDQRHRQVPVSTGRTEQGRHAQRGGLGPQCRDMAVRTTARHGGRGGCGHERLPGQGPADHLDQGTREM